MKRNKCLLGIISAILFIFAAQVALAQDVWSLPGVMAACGPKDQKLEVGAVGSPPSPEHLNGQARIYFVLEYPRVSNPSLKVRVGMGGRWIGELQNKSYFQVAAQPGIHHLCVSGDWPRWTLSKAIALYGLDVKPNTTYYIRVRFLYPSRVGVLLGIDEVNPDEGKFLVSTSRDVSSPHSIGGKNAGHTP